MTVTRVKWVMSAASWWSALRDSGRSAGNQSLWLAAASGAVKQTASCSPGFEAWQLRCIRSYGLGGTEIAHPSSLYWSRRRLT